MSLVVAIMDLLDQGSHPSPPTFVGFPVDEAMLSLGYGSVLFIAGSSTPSILHGLSFENVMVMALGTRN